MSSAPSPSRSAATSDGEPAVGSTAGHAASVVVVVSRVVVVRSVDVVDGSLAGSASSSDAQLASRTIARTPSPRRSTGLLAGDAGPGLEALVPLHPRLLRGIPLDVGAPRLVPLRPSWSATAGAATAARRACGRARSRAGPAGRARIDGRPQPVGAPGAAGGGAQAGPRSRRPARPRSAGRRPRCEIGVLDRGALHHERLGGHVADAPVARRAERHDEAGEPGDEVGEAVDDPEHPAQRAP